MFWVIKRIFKVILLLCVLALIVIAAVILFVNPNNFKKEMNEFIHNFTGYAFEINGPIRWTFKPELALLLQDISLPNPTDAKTPLIKVKEANVYLDAYSLLSGELIVNKLEIKDLNGNLQHLGSPGTPNINSTTAIAKEEPSRKMLVKELILQNASLTLKDEKLDYNWTLSNANITAKNLVLNPLTKLEPIVIKGDLTNLDNHLTLNLDTTVTADLEKHTLNLDPIVMSWNEAKLKGTTIVSQFLTGPIIIGDLSLESLDVNAISNQLNPRSSNEQVGSIQKIQAKFNYNYNSQDKFLDLSKISLQMDEGSLSGDIKITFVEAYKVNLELNAEKINLLSAAKIIATIFPGFMPQNDDLIPMDMLKNSSLEGKISGKNVNLGPEFLIDNMTGLIATQNSILSLNPLTLSAYKGNHNCGISIDLSKETPIFKVTEQANDVVLEPLLKLLNLPNTVMGTAETKITVQATGNSLASLKQSLTGGINLNIKDGSVFGINLDTIFQYTMTNIIELLKQSTFNSSAELANLIGPKISDWMSTQKNNPTTAFQTLEFKADLKQGTGNSSLAMTSSTYDLKGNGGFNLIDSKINYSTQITNKSAAANTSDEVALSLKQTPLSMAVSGTVDKLIFNPDLQNYAMAAIKKVQDVSTKKMVDQMVSSAGANTKTSKRADEIFLDGLKGLSK